MDKLLSVMNGAMLPLIATAAVHFIWEASKRGLLAFFLLPVPALLVFGIRTPTLTTVITASYLLSFAVAVELESVQPSYSLYLVLNGALLAGALGTEVRYFYDYYRGTDG